MKKSVYITGISFLVILFTGIVFKRLHLAGASIMVTLGILLYIFAYLPSFLISVIRQTKEEGHPISKLLLYLGSPGILLLTFGILSKIMHWPGANIGLWGGIGLISFALLLQLITNPKSNEKISMISVLIVVILLGSFSFNMFRFGNIRAMDDAYEISGSSFSESSRLLWQRCEEIMSAKVFPDSTILAPPVKKELIVLHTLVQETDLVIGGMVERIRIAEDSAINIQSPAQKDKELSESLSGILIMQNGMLSMDRKINETIDFINTMTSLDAGEKKSLISSLENNFGSGEAGLVYKYFGVYNLMPEVCVNSMLLWKSRIWETEYRIMEKLIQW